MVEKVILVDEADTPIGLMEKMEAHRKGALHRAFSVFIFNSKGDLLLQQRALDKYHSAGQWTNTCCSHPRDGESTLNAAKRRLREEMGIACDLDYQFHFQYKAAFENGLIEHEIDHVLFGYTDAVPQLNPEEAADYRYVSLPELQRSILTQSELYTPWFKICFERVVELNSFDPPKRIGNT